MGFRNQLISLSVSDITDGTIGGLWVIGNPAGAHVEIGTNGLGESGIRLYGADGVTLHAELDIGQLALLLGGLKTAPNGRRIEIGTPLAGVDAVSFIPSSIFDIAGGMFVGDEELSILNPHDAAGEAANVHLMSGAAASSGVSDLALYARVLFLGSALSTSYAFGELWAAAMGGAVSPVQTALTTETWFSRLNATSAAPASPINTTLFTWNVPSAPYDRRGIVRAVLDSNITGAGTGTHVAELNVDGGLVAGQAFHQGAVARRDEAACQWRVDLAAGAAHTILLTHTKTGTHTANAEAHTTLSAELFRAS
jgi:hypothetical protein